MLMIICFSPLCVSHWFGPHTIYLYYCSSVHGVKNRIGLLEVDVKCMQTNFGGCSFLGFGDFFAFKFPFGLVDASLFVSEILLISIFLDFPSDHGLLSFGSKN